MLEWLAFFQNTSSKCLFVQTISASAGYNFEKARGDLNIQKGLLTI